MATGKKLSVDTWIFRLFLLIWAIVPFFYWQQFYGHFYTYLTGTIITGLITSQWQVVLFFIVFFTLFIIPLTYRKRAKWVDYGLVTAFFVSLFFEMYGIPLTIIFAAKYFFVPGAQLPQNFFEFDFLGVGVGMDHAMVYGSVFIILGMILILVGWWSLYQQSKHSGFAQGGLYKFSRHPQYLGFIFLIVGWLIGWPTILTIIFSPILIYKYIKAAQAEEKDMFSIHGDSYRQYYQKTPFLI